MIDIDTESKVIINYFHANFEENHIYGEIERERERTKNERKIKLNIKLETHKPIKYLEIIISGGLIQRK